ncbi:MAG: sigma-54-dependent Fis family transcriptional regulator [Pseudomonadales bacterium]|nr:sigma-54-dependent Fis family transcriptional regulator [Pseudomonadales bacterium]
MTRVLVVEPDESSRRNLRGEFERIGIDVIEASHLKDALRADAGQADAVVANAALAVEARDFLALSAPAPVVLVADSPSIEQAVECMRLGAADYVPQPFEPATLIAAVERATSRATPAVGGETPFPTIVGHCAAMRDLLDQVGTWGPTEATVLIQGESGTGKELIARALHASSRRRHAQVIAFNCAAIPETMIEPELFGLDSRVAKLSHAARPGLIEAADGGTLFLDEVADMPPPAQARLVCFLKDGQVRRFGSAQTRDANVRIIAATRQDLGEFAGRDRYSDDLFQCIDAVLHVPPLRDRGEDVVVLAQAVLERTCNKLNKQGLTFAAAALDAMRAYPWPGNVRELENAVERAVILTDEGVIDAERLAIGTGRVRLQAAEPEDQTSSLEDYFLHFVLDHEDQFTETELAAKLGISRKSLWERRQRLNIPRRRTRKRGPRRS